LLHFSARRDANIDAARWGDLPAVRGLRRDRLDQDLDGLVLHRAARGHTEVVAFLLEERHDLRVAAGCYPVQVPDGKSLLAARVRLNAVTQWHCRWEYPWMKHGEAAGTGGNETMKGVGIACGTRDVYASDFGHMAHEA